MSFSVLISLYYKEKSDNLIESLKSVFSQTMRAEEVIVVEDGLLNKELYDVLDEFAALYPELIRVKLNQNMGLGRALNEGLKHCNNDLIIRMDTDDISYPDRFEKQITFMEKYPEVDISSGWIVEFEGTKENIKAIKKLPESHIELTTYIKTRCPINHPAAIFKKSKVLEVGGYKHFPLFEDYYLWGRMMQKGAIFANIQEPLLYFRISDEMFKRRGGLKYAFNSVRLQNKLYELGLISLAATVKSCFIRSVVYLMPNFIRRYIYSKFLRS